MENNTKIRTVKHLLMNMNKGTYNLEHIVQRQGGQWAKQQKALLIDSIFKNIVIPQIVFCEKDGETFVVDGKQRLEALQEYTSSKIFNKLSEEEKDKVFSAEISTITYINVNDEEIFEIFERYNNGVNLSGSQKLRSTTTPTILNEIKATLANPFFIKCNITKGQKKKNEDETTILQACMLAGGFDFKNFSYQEVERYLKETKEEEILKNIKKINENATKLDKIITKKEKNLKKIHLPAILAFCDGSKEFDSKLTKFLTNYENETTYRQYCQGSTSQKENVMGRVNYWKK
jgi:uncharacterized protein YjgD (DUF1641 family)